MTFGDFKRLDYSDNIPISKVIEDLMHDNIIDYAMLSTCYVKSLENRIHEHKSKFNEATTSLMQLLCGNFTKDEDRDKIVKRAIHIMNLNKEMFPHILDSKYGYAKEDEEYWDNFCKRVYGTTLE